MLVLVPLTHAWPLLVELREERTNRTGIGWEVLEEGGDVDGVGRDKILLRLFRGGVQVLQVARGNAVAPVLHD